MLDIHTHIGSYAELKDGSTKGRENLLAAMQESGVTQAVVLPIPTGPEEQVSDEHNQLVIDMVQDHSELIPFCCVDVGEDADPGAQVRRAYELGARGVKIHPVLQKRSIADEDFFDAYAAAAELRIPALIHTGQFIGHKIAGKSQPGALRLAHTLEIDDVAERFADLKIVLGHFGWPWSEEAMAIMTRRDNVWVDLAGFSPKYIPDSVWAQITKVASHKFVFGTDFPFLGLDRWLSDFKARGVSEAVFEKVTSTNAKMVLNLA